MQISGCCFSANKRSNVSATLYTRNGRRRRNGELRLSRGEEEGGRRDGETVAKGDPRVSQIFLHDRLSNLPTRCAVEFRQHRLECETERATGFIVSARSHEDLAPQLSKCSTVESVAARITKLKTPLECTFVSCFIRELLLFPVQGNSKIFNPSCSR